MIKLKYGNTNTFFLPGEKGGRPVYPDHAGMPPVFYRTLESRDATFISPVLADLGEMSRYAYV